MKTVFFHVGDPWYLKYTAAQARRVQDTSTDFALLGARESEMLTNGKAQGGQAGELWTTFERVYVHLSTNSEAFERACWKRWFVILALMERERLERIQHVDSDVVLLKPADWFWQTFGEPGMIASLSVPPQEHASMRWSVGGHCSLWTFAGLETFCRFCIELFELPELRSQLEQKWMMHQSQGRPGGICDMTALYFFWKTRKNCIVDNLKPRDGCVVDFNFCTSENGELSFQTQYGSKRLLSGVGLSGVTTSVPSERLEFACLHCQGSGKGHIPRLVPRNLVHCSPRTRLQDHLKATKLRCLRAGADMIGRLRGNNYAW